MDDSAQPDGGALTTMHVRRAMLGNADSLEWIVRRLTPLLLVQAEYRLGARLRQHVDPEDLVDEAWLVALPRLAGLAHHERTTPVLLRFLTTTMIHQVSRLLRRSLVEGEAPVTQLPDSASGVITRVVRGEVTDAVRVHLEALEASDREVIVLRGIEQHPSRTVAVMLDISPAAVDQRYARALKRLRSLLPDSVFAELEGA